MMSHDSVTFTMTIHHSVLALSDALDDILISELLNSLVLIISVSANHRLTLV